MTPRSLTARSLLVPLLLVFALVASVAALSARTGGPDTARAAPPDAPAADPPGSGVSVEGVGAAAAPPDVVRFTIGVEGLGPTVQEALSASNEATRQVLDELQSLGVADRDVQTSNLSLHPRYGREDVDGREAPQIEGYVARQDLGVLLRDVEEAGATIGAAVEAAGDAARLQGVSFGLDDDSAVRAQARERAFADARRTAEQYAELADRTLGEVLEISERSTVGGPVAFAADESAAGGALPLAAGATEVTVTVEVRWALT